ncbi:hypothetical protein MarSH_119 [Marseillevirus Shanghai 1]|nr:hypothetical protein MarSH_119 [Marseillevirus Shanghai 1]
MQEQSDTLSETEICELEKEGNIWFHPDEKPYREHVSVLNGNLGPFPAKRTEKLQFDLTTGFDFVNRLSVQGQNIRKITFSTDDEELFSFPVSQQENPFVVDLPFAFPSYLTRYQEIHISFDAENITSVTSLGNFYERNFINENRTLKVVTPQGKTLMFDNGTVKSE